MRSGTWAAMGLGLSLVGLAACRGGDDKSDGRGDGGADDGGGDDGGPDSGDSGDTGAPPAPVSPADDLLNALEAASAGPIEAHVNEGQLRSVSVDLPRPAVADPVEAARAVLADWGGLWGVTNADEQLIPARVRVDEEDGSTSVWFSVRYGGVPVYGAEVAVFTVGDRVTGLHGSVPRVRPVAPPPALTVANAAEALDSAGWEPRETPRLTFWDPGLFGGPRTGPVLAWRARGWSSEEGGGEAFVDAQTGALLTVEPEERTWDVEVVSVGNEGPADVIDRCWRWYDGETWFEDDDHSGGDWPGPGLDPYYDGPTSFQAIHDNLNWWLARWQRKGWDDDDGAHEAYIKVGSGWQNASWLKGCNQMQYGVGYAQPDIVGHELMHGINVDVNGLVYRWESGAIDEGLADLFSEWAVGDGSHEIGETIHSSFGFGVRDLFAEDDGRPKTYVAADIAATPGDLANDFGGVHFFSSLVSRSILLTTPDHGVATTLPTPGFPDLGLAQCLAWYVTHAKLGASSRIPDLRNAYLIALNEGACGAGPTAANRCVVLNAFGDIGIGAGDADCDGLESGAADPNEDADPFPDATDNCPGVANLTQSDVDGDGLGDACDPNQDDDAFFNADDLCPLVATSTADNTDADGDGIGDACDDSDGDGWMDLVDNCPAAYDPWQSDTDGDGQGNVCDSDDDGDGVPDASDLCPKTWSSGPSADTDGDTIGDECDVCPTVDDDQADCDGDGIGAACTGTGTAAEASEVACQQAKLAETIENSIDDLNIPFHFAAEIPLPTCIQCGAWVDPTKGLLVEISSAGRTDTWAIIDSAGRQVATGRVNLRAGGPLTLRYKASPGARAVMPATGEIYRDVSFRLVQLDGINHDSVTFSVTPR